MVGLIRSALSVRLTQARRIQRRHFLPLLLGGAATVCAAGFIGIAGIVIGDNLYRNWKERKQQQVVSGDKGTKIDSGPAEKTNSTSDNDAHNKSRPEGDKTV